MSAPAHKNLKNPPGQVKNYPKCLAALRGGCFCDGSCMGQKDKTLNDYIERKMDVVNMSVEDFLQMKKDELAKKQGKLTYEQWYEDNQWEIEQSDDPCKKAWYAGQENK